jgi:type IV pilus assembly protein PilA
MKKNGFTFIELLAMLIILGIIMLIAIPNISGMLKNQKLDKYKHDAINMVEAAKVKAKSEKSLIAPKSGDCIVFTLKYLDSNESIVTGPNGGKYDKFDSIVVYTRKASKYKYYVRLVEDYKGKRTGFHLVDSNNINSLKTINIDNIEDNIGLTREDRGQTALNKIGVFGVITAECSNIRDYYSGVTYCTLKDGEYYDNEGNKVPADMYSEICE